MFPSLAVHQPRRAAPDVDGATTNAASYGQILTSTALIGGASVINIALGIVRAKAMAVFIGPSGVGVMGLYSAVADVTQSLAGMGIHASGVRQIADAVGSGDRQRISTTAVVVKHVSLGLGLFGALALVLWAPQISRLTFGSSAQAAGIALLAIAVLLRLLSAGQTAVIQGLRRIPDLARMTILGAVGGTIITIPMVYFLRDAGIVPSLIAVAAAALLASWWQSRKIRFSTPKMGWKDVGRETAALVKLGGAFMVSGFLTMGAAYAIRVFVVRFIGAEAAGLYQAAWTLGGLYVGFVLQAMSADFYPRLTAAVRNHAECNRLVNEQAHISLLLAGPGVIGTLSIAPIVLTAFYSPEFAAAVNLLRWICLGMILRVVAWPMGFIVLAAGAQQIFLWTEVAAATVHLALAWLLVSKFGLVGAGGAFFGLYVWHGLLIYLIVRRMTGFRWSAANREVGMIFLPTIALIFCAFYLLPDWLATSTGVLATTVCGVYSARRLLVLVPSASVPAFLQSWVRRL